MIHELAHYKKLLHNIGYRFWIGGDFTLERAVVLPPERSITIPLLITDNCLPPMESVPVGTLASLATQTRSRHMQSSKEMSTGTARAFARFVIENGLQRPDGTLQTPFVFPASVHNYAGRPTTLDQGDAIGNFYYCVPEMFMQGPELEEFVAQGGVKINAERGDQKGQWNLVYQNFKGEQVAAWVRIPFKRDLSGCIPPRRFTDEDLRDKPFNIADQGLGYRQEIDCGLLQEIPDVDAYGLMIFETVGFDLDPRAHGLVHVHYADIQGGTTLRRYLRRHTNAHLVMGGRSSWMHDGDRGIRYEVYGNMLRRFRPKDGYMAFFKTEPIRAS